MQIFAQMYYHFNEMFIAMINSNGVHRQAHKLASTRQVRTAAPLGDNNVRKNPQVEFRVFRAEGKVKSILVC